MKLKNVPEKDYVEEAHGPVYSFFSSFGTYILNIMSANLMFVIFNIPMAFVAFLATVYFLPQLNSLFLPENFVAAMEKVGIAGNELNNAIGSEAVYQLYYLIVLFIAMFLLGTTLFCIGPFQCGFSRIYRNMYRNEGVFFFSDFKDGMVNNLKQSLWAMGISLVTTSLILFSIVFYSRMNNSVGTAISAMFVFLFLVFILIQNMVYQMIVSVDLPLKKIYMNAILFFLLKVVPCFGLIIAELLVLVVIPVLLFSTFTFFGYAIAVFIYLTLSFGFCQYMMAYFTGQMINKYIVTKLESSEESESEDESDDDDDDDESDEDNDEEEDEESDDSDSDDASDA